MRFGAVLYRAITGFSPPEAPSRFTQDEYEPLETVAKGTYRPAFMEAVDWAMRLLPEARPKTIDEWRQSLLKDEPVPSAPVTTAMSTETVSGQTMAYTQGVDQPCAREFGWICAVASRSADIDSHRWQLALSDAVGNPVIWWCQRTHIDTPTGKKWPDGLSATR